MKKAAIAGGLAVVAILLLLPASAPQMTLVCRVAAHTNGAITYDGRGQSNGWVNMTYRREPVLVVDVINATNTVYFEHSEDHKTWLPYPAAYFQLTITLTNPMPIYVALDRPALFLRARY